MNQVKELETPASSATGSSQLDQLRAFTKIVADTGEFSAIKKFRPQDATTNPSLIFKAAQNPEYKPLVDEALRSARKSSLSGDALVKAVMDQLLVLFGAEILRVVPGRVSTETDADLSFNTEGLLQNAHRLIELYHQKNVPRERVLIKLASTWEGIRAAEQLQKEGINCNMTLLFSLPQAVACAEAKARLISPFVGRILDWYKAKTGKNYTAAEDPGVQSVRAIYTYYKRFGHDTEVMGASFRNKDEVLELAGCDLLTISPPLLEELSKSNEPVQRKLTPAMAQNADVQRLEVNEKTFRWLMNEDAMATEKLSEGIRLFNADAQKLKKYIQQMI